MRQMRALLIRLAGLFRTKHYEQEMAEELESHLEMAIEDNLRSGMTPQEARRQALIKLGGLEQTKEIYRDRRGLPFLETLFQDFRYGLRMLVKDPGFSVVAVVTLALGIGANATVFSMVNGLMLRPPEIEDPSRVVAVLMTDPAKGPGWGWDMKAVSAPDFVAWREQSRSFSGMVASELDTFALTGEGEPERVPGMRVSADYFDVLGVGAAVGRTIVPGEDQPGSARVVVLGHRLWQRRFAADAAVIGKTVRLNREPHTVIGVMPEGFRIGYRFEQLWTPLVFPPERLVPAARVDRSLDVLARLKPGVGAEAASAEMATLARRAEEDHPGTTRGWGARAMVLQKVLAAEFKFGMGIQMSAVLLLLLIACANIASLQLTRAAARHTEMAVRAALGASRLRLLRQLLMESLLVAPLGGGLGLLFAWGGVAAFRSGFQWDDNARAMALAISIDSDVLVFTLAISMLAAILFGLAPAFHQTAVNLHLSLKEGGRTISQAKARRRGHTVLVAAQIALALALVTGSGLITWGFLYKIYRDLGIDPQHVLTANVRLSDDQYKVPSQRAAFFREAIERLEAIPGVVSAGGTTTLAPSGEGSRWVTFSTEGQPVLPRDQRQSTRYFAISPHFLSTLRVRLLRGRGFSDRDDAEALAVALVNQAFVRRYLGDQEPLGKRLRFDTADSDRTDWSEIVGVVGNITDQDDRWEDPPQVYEPYLQRPSPNMTLAIRTATDPSEFPPHLRRAVWSVDKDQPLNRVQPMEQAVADNRAVGVLLTGLMGSYSVSALVMAIVGVFGVMAYTVAQRTHEIGIRMALGAGKSDILMMISKKAVAVTAAGLAIGLMLATPILWLPESVDSDMPFGHRIGLVLAAGSLIWLAALLASYIPARRAIKVDPTVALRCE